LNSPSSSLITFEVLGLLLHFSQDPNSKHHGTTVWDASMVLAKFLERNCRKGQFCLNKLKGKRAIELGAGCGLAGFGMALLGCNVISTDQKEVLPLLMRNVERNILRIKQANLECSASMGSIQVAELDWGNSHHIAAVDPPFDYVIGTDIVYAEHLLDPLVATLNALSGPKTTILLGYELRSTNVHEKMMNMWKTNYEVKSIPKSKMDPKYQHSSIQLFVMRLKMTLPQQVCNCGVAEIKHGDDENIEIAEDMEDYSHGDEEGIKERKEDLGLENKKHLNEWETRRYGSLAARLLQNVKVT
ncbi:hypothetical protein AMTR_s00124p00014420, partial [Amborella trichopoda]